MENSGVYLIINKVNQKYYIGSTISFKLRWSRHISGKGNIHLYNAIKKYGIKNFEFIILEEIDVSINRNNLHIKEQFWMDKFNVNDDSCYNINKTAKPNLTKKRDKSFSEKIRQIRLSLAIGSKKIIQYSLNGEFIKEWKSSSEAGRVLGLESRNIIGACNKDQLTAFNFIWRFESEKLSKEFLERVKNKRTKSKKVNQKDLLGNIIFTYETMKECSEITGFNYTRIGVACNKKIKYHNFYWEFTTSE